VLRNLLFALHHAGGEGTLGRKISLSANHFAVLIKNPSVFHYDVDLNPVPPSALFRYLK